MFFKDVINQEDVKERLIHAVQDGRVAHAQLFLGNSGTGGLPLARAYAQYVNCLNRTNTDSCGECASCHKMQVFTHPDLHFTYPFISKPNKDTESVEYFALWKKALTENPYLDYHDWMEQIDAENKQGNISAFECRAILRRLSLKPMYEGYKILIMWLPEYLGKEGNILLKSLEEPPENTLFLLVAQDEESILPTILSRTQMIRIPRLRDEDIKKALITTAGLNEESADRIAKLADGDYNHALKLSEATENDYSNEFMNWMRMCYVLQMGPLLKWVDSMAGTGRENQKSFLLYSISLLRECLLSNKGLQSMNKILDSERDFVQKFSPFVHEGNVFTLVNAFNDSYYHIGRNAHPKILFLNLSLQVNELLRQKAGA